MKSVPYTKPSITNLEVKYAKDAAKNGWGKNCYDYIYKFEKIFKRHLNTRYSISTSSCTGALHMGMHALGISRGDEVILADTNWVATAAPIIHLGAKPIYVDILPDTWCIDPDKIENISSEIVFIDKEKLGSLSNNILDLFFVVSNTLPNKPL